MHFFQVMLGRGNQANILKHVSVLWKFQHILLDRVFVVQLLISHVQLFATPTDCGTVLYYFLELVKFMSIESVMLSV